MHQHDVQTDTRQQQRPRLRIASRGKKNRNLMKKALEMQTLRAGKVEPKKFRPAATPFPGAQEGQNLISWRWSLPLPTNPVW